MRFYLFDKVIAAERGKMMVATKLVNLMDTYFEGHYRQQPIMPATLIIEALAQVGGMLNTLNHNGAVEMVLMLVDGVKMTRPTRQGDLLTLEIKMIYDHPYGATMSGVAYIGDEVIATADRIVFAHEITTDPKKIAMCRERFYYQTGGYSLLEAN
jgi:3-hydroxyacyl-[acyl-carrier-protein] dehydratase